MIKTVHTEGLPDNLILYMSSKQGIFNLILTDNLIYRVFHLRGFSPLAENPTYNASKNFLNFSRHTTHTNQFLFKYMSSSNSFSVISLVSARIFEIFLSK
jgi:hypothetical protein